MSASAGAELRSVPPLAYLLRALVEWESWFQVTRVGDLVQEGRDRFSLTLRAKDMRSESTVPAAFDGLKGFGLFGPSAKPLSTEHPQLLHHWKEVPETLRREGALLLLVVMARAHWESFMRPRLEGRLEALGLRMLHENWVTPERGEVWLYAEAEVQWPPPDMRAGRLLERIVRLNGGPVVKCALTETTKPVVKRPYPQPTLQPDREWRMEVSLLPPGDALDETKLIEFVRSLDRAQKDAPRGFVGLKQFRDRILMPMSTSADRELVLDAALAAGIAVVRQVTDPKTGNLTAAIELIASHPVVSRAVTVS